MTAVQMMIIDTLYEQGKLQKVIAEKTGCFQSAASKCINVKCLLEGKSVVGDRDDYSLVKIAMKG